jgi:hypothetical protein
MGEGMADELNSMSDEEEPTESADMQPLEFIIMVCAAAPCENMDQVRTMYKCKRRLSFRGQIDRHLLFILSPRKTRIRECQRTGQWFSPALI